MAAHGETAALPPDEVREWRRRLLHGDWHLWDLELFQALLGALGVVTSLLAVVLVRGMTHHDGDVRISVLFVTALVMVLLVVRGAARAGLRTAERRTAATAALEARRAYLDAIRRGAPVRAGAASTFVARSATEIGEYLARAVPARVMGVVVPVGVLVADAVPICFRATPPALASESVNVGGVPRPRSAVSFDAALVTLPFALCSPKRTVSVEARNPFAFGAKTTEISHCDPGARAPVQDPCEAWYSAVWFDPGLDEM